MRDVEGLEFSRDGAVATVRLNRPERLNAITDAMQDGLADFAEECAGDASIRAVVITGTGRAFSAGDDISGTAVRRQDVTATHGMVNADIGAVNRIVKGFMSMSKPVIAALNGRTHGAGFVLACASDFRVARSDALIGDIRAANAIFAGQGTPLLLPRLIGHSRAIEMLMTGAVIDAAEAERWGLVTHVWPPETFDEELARFVEGLAHGPTQIMAAWKLATNHDVLSRFDSYSLHERLLANVVRNSVDAEEGVRAFREKRRPEYTGH